MPLDSITITALTAELSAALTGAKIDKVQQPARDMLLLTVHGESGTQKLLLACGTGNARAHITQNTFENPKAAPMFCMLLRKHLIGARIAQITQPNRERMIVFDLSAFDELGDPAPKKLIIEMMGRVSNVILVSAEGHITDCLRRMDGGENPTRQVLPGLIYHMPPKPEKPAFLGLSPLILRELTYRATGDVAKPIESFTAPEKSAFDAEFSALQQRVETASFEPTIILIGESPKDFSFMPILQYETAAKPERYPSFSAMLDAFHTTRDKTEHLRRKSQALLKSIKSAHGRAVRKLALRREELAKAGQREQYRKKGDLVTANLHRLKKGDERLECEDYFTENSPLIEIRLDPLKTPQQNAAAFYRDYTKSKTAELYLTDLIAKGEREESYLAGVIDEIERAENERDLDEIRRELIETGYLRAPKATKKDKFKPSEPMKFISSTGMEIQVGKNNAQNDLLTTRIARRTDIWLHAQKIHGSHVVITCNDAAPDATTLTEAANLAAYFSQSRNGGKIPVDYTPIRNLKKPPGALPGMVIYTEYKTLIAEPNAALVERLKA